MCLGWRGRENAFGIELKGAKLSSLGYGLEVLGGKRGGKRGNLPAIYCG
jgi:hypothetical protein